MRIAFVSALVLCLAAASAKPSGAVVIYSSGSNFISSPIIENFGSTPVVIAEGTANLTVLSTVSGSGGGDEPALLAQGDASVSVIGGMINVDRSGANLPKPRAGIRLLENSRLTLVSGVIRESGSGIDVDRAGILAEGNSQVTMLGGSLIAGAGSGLDSSDTFGIRALGNAQVSILGGTITANQFPDSISTILSAGDSSRITIFGNNFNFPLGAIGPLSGTLTGKLQDGTSISWSFTHTATSSITLVPEPSTLSLLAIGIGAFAIRLRRKAA